MDGLKQWMIAAVPAEIRELALLSGTSRGYLYQLANGQRKASAEIAGNVAAAAKAIRVGKERRLPRLGREGVSAVCSKCEYARKCTGVQG